MSSVNCAKDLRSFWTKNPDLWFIKLEVIFYLNCVVDERTKASMAISYLSSEIVAVVSDLVTNPDPVKPYTCLKERLIAVYSAVPRKSLVQALHDRMEDGLRPSKILALVLELNKVSCNESVVKSIFLEQLPRQIQTILATERCTDLQELGKLADDIVKTVKPPYNASFTRLQFRLKHALSKIKSVKTSFYSLRSQVTRLEEKLARLSRKSRKRSFRKRKRLTSSSFVNNSRSSSSSSRGSNNNDKNKDYSCCCLIPCANHSEHLIKIKNLFCS